MAEEPVEIELRLDQNVVDEAGKASQGINDLSEASAKMRQDFEKNIAAQKKEIGELTAEVARLKAQLAAPVNTGDSKLIADKEKLTQTIAELEKKLKQAEVAYNSLINKSQSTNKVTDKAVGSFNNLNFSIQQVARELPVLAMSPQMFIMAISNNLPILQDQLKKTRIQNEALKASGQSIVPVWRQVLSSLISWQTALVAGITLLTVYGKDIVDWVKRTLDLAGSIRMTTKEIKEMKEELAKNMGFELGKLNSLFDQLRDAEKGTYNYYKAKKDIISQFGTYLQGLDDEKRALEDVEGAYRALTESIRDQARQKALNRVYEEQGEQVQKIEVDQFTKIREQFIGKLGKDAGETLFQSLRRELQSGALSEGMKRLVEGFTVSGTTAFTTNSGQIIESAYEYNNVADAIDKVVLAHQAYNAKIKEAESILGAISGGNSPRIKSLIQEQELLLAQAKLMPESTEAEIDAKNKKIKDIEEEIKRLKTLGIVSEKELDKQVRDKEKAANDLLKIQTRMEQEIAAASIAAMKEGINKQIAEARAAYDKRRDTIAEKLREIEELEKTTGMPATGQRNLLANLLEAETARFEAEKEALRAAAQQEVDSIFSDVNQRFTSQLQNQLNGIDGYYEGQLKLLRENVTDMKALQKMTTDMEAMRAREMTIARREFALQTLSFEEEIALKRQEISNRELTWESDKQKKLLEIQIDFALKRLMALNDIKLSGGDAEEEIARLRAEIERLNKLLNQTNGNKLREIADVIAKSVRQIGSELSSLPGKIGEIGKALTGLADNADNIVTIFDKNTSDTDIISAGVNGLANLFGMVAGQLAENKELQEQWNEKIREAAHQAALARIELQAYQEGNIFGVENPYARAIAGANEYAEAINELNKSASILAQGQVQVGTTKKVSGANVAKGVGSGAAVGAAVGSFIPVVGTAVGAVVGGILGGITGLFAKKSVPVFESLAKKYGKIFDSETYELNPQILQDYALLDDATKKLVDNWQEMREKALEAEKQMRDTFKDLAGDIGSQLSDALVSAFRNNDLTTALNQFEDGVAKVIENIIAQMVFAAFFQDMLKELEDGMMASFKEGGDGSIIDDLLKFTEQYAAAIPGFNEALQAWKDDMESRGINVFGPDSARSAAPKGIAQANQDSVDELNGRITNIQQMIYDIRGNGSQSLEINNELLSHQRMIKSQLDTIAENSQHLKRLVTIENSLTDINLKGVKIKQ